METYTPSAACRHRTRPPRSALFLVAALSLPALAGCAPDLPPDVVFISLDTTRKDHLSVYGYPRDTSPLLERLAESGTVFDNATAQMTITNPSHASMFTGLYPHTHKVGENTRTLPDERVTLTEVLATAGYQTGGFVSGHPLRAAITGIDQGFETYDSEFKRRRNGRQTTDAALAWLAGRSRERPFFLFVHYYDAHGPYKPPAEYLDRFTSAEPGPRLGFIPRYQKVRDADGKVLRRLNHYVDRYDALLRYQDDLVAEILAELDLDRTLVVIVADHGETLGERATALNLNHGTSTFEEQVAIPMVFHGPGVARQRIRQPVETVDLMPTILDLVGIEAPIEAVVQGSNLAALTRGEGEEKGEELAYASNRARTQNHADRGYELRKRDFIHSVRSRRWKLIRYPGVEEDYLELYDLDKDPGETRNLADPGSPVQQGLAEAIERWKVDELDDGGLPAELSPEDVEQLRALGYVGG